MRRRGWGLGAALLAAGGLAGCQAVPDARLGPEPPAVAALFATPVVQAATLRAARATLTQQPGGCAEPRLRATDVRRPTEQVRLAPSGAVQSGAWLVTVNVAECGRWRTQRVVVGVLPGGRLFTTGLLRGDSIADPLLSVDLSGAIVQSGPAVMGCAEGVQVLDTRLDTIGDVQPSARPGQFRRAWEEVWTLRGCESGPVDLRIRLTPGARGTGYVLEWPRPPARS